MFREPAPISAPLRQHDPLADDDGVPSEVANDHAREATTAVRDAEEVVYVNEFGLELDEEQRPMRRMPGDEIDDASLAEMVERHLRPDLPPRRSKHPGHRFGHVRVALGEHAIERAASPARLDRELDLEDGRDPAKLPEGDLVEMTTLDRRIQPQRDPSLLCDVALPPVEALPKPAKHATDADVIHRAA